jgi:4-aminobutyrate--pyruvate transaminase
VICGFGRTGNFWGSQTFNLKPDMMTTAKALSSAYLPISALLVSEPIYQAMVQESEKIGIFGHGFTYSGHPVAATVALEAIAIFEERNILDHLRRVGPGFREGLRRFADHPLVGEVRGVGLIGGVEIVQDKASRKPFAPSDGVGPYLSDKLQEHGVITRVIGDTAAFAPPLIITADEIGEMLDSLGQALDETADWAAGRGLLS